MSSRALGRAAPALALAAAALVPFLDKAFTVDDTVFLREAEHAVVDPLHPTAFEMVWESDAPARLAPTSGPVMAWLLVPAILAGGSERVAHLVQLAMLALALAATVSLGLRLGLAPAWAAASGLLLASAPALLGMAGTAMADVPAMSLGVLGLERLLAWREERRLHQAILAAALLGLAPLARSHLLLVLGVGALLLGAEVPDPSLRRGERWRRWLPLLAAPALTALVALAVRDPAPVAASLVATTGTTLDGTRIPRNAVAFATHWVLALPLALPWVLVRPAPMARRWPALLLGTALAAAALWLARGPPAHPSPYFVAPVAGLGIAVLWDILADGWERRDRVQLALGCWLLVALAATPYFQVPAKYLVASAPAAALLVAREMSRRPRRRSLAVLGLTCALGTALGVAILRADAAFSGQGRAAAAALVAPQVAAGRTVWFVGHWGFQWYAERAGGRIVTLAPPYPAPGDLVVVSRNSSVGYAMERFLMGLRLRLLGIVQDRTPGGRLMSDGAGFYDHGRGFLPWTLGSGVLEAFLVAEVE